MINHGRTLLLNADGGSRPSSSFFLEEYVPPDFKAVKLPFYLQEVRSALFKNNPDLSAMNIRLAHLMRAIHATEFDEYLLDLDSRITYLHDVNEAFVTKEFSYTKLVEDAADLFPVQISEAPTVGNTYYRYLIKASGTSTLDITGLNGDLSSSSVSVSGSNNITDIIPLPGNSRWSFRVSSFPLNSGDTWEVQILALPTEELSLMADRIENLSSGVLSNLFGSPATGKYRTFKFLWERHGLLPYRLSGVALAYIYRVEEIRNG